MKTDTVIRVEAMKILIENLGEVDAERFVTMITQDAFDYTEWQRNLWDGLSIEELHARAAEYEQALGN